MNTVSTEFPDLRDCKRFAIDVETCDPQLKELGPGVRRGAFIAGVSVGYTHDGKRYSNYYPIRHEHGTNLDPDNVMRYLRDNVCGADQECVGTNLLYDLDFLEEEGVKVRGKLFDVQVAEPLIDEDKRGRYDLGSLSEDYLGIGKKEDELYQYLADHYGGSATRATQAGRIWKAPGDIAAPYACSDVENPLGIIHKQLEIIEAQNLTEVWQLEQDLQPMLLAMRRRGVRIDEEQARSGIRDTNSRIDAMRQLLLDNNVVASTASTIGKYCDLMGISYPLTPKSGQPSITDGWLQDHLDDEVLAAVSEVRKAEKSSGTFLQGLLRHAVNGRVHALFNQLNSDKYGTVSGRFSSSNPNLQNQPSRDPVMFKLIRGAFVPEPGELWGGADYSQIEYRLLVEYAFREFKGGKKSRELMQRFIENPSTDMHEEVAIMVFNDPDMRGPGKGINFGMVYGLGLEALIESLGFPRDECIRILDTYHAEMPFAKAIYRTAQERATARGWIRTLGGRVRRFNTWEPKVPWQAAEGTFNDLLKEWMKWDGKEWKRDLQNRPKAMRWEEAQTEYEGIVLERAKTYTALNALLQGSAADIMKRSMVDIWKSGVCDVLGAPLLTVHDELNWSVPDTKEGREAFDESVRIMESVYSDRIKIPLKVDAKLGANWSEVK